MHALAVDIETYDPALKEEGPGWARGYGHILGVSFVSLGGGIKEFIPWGKDNSRIQELMQTPVPKIGANLMYDIGWLMYKGINCVGPFYDVQFAEALIDPNARSYSLDTLAKKYLNKTKASKELYNYLRKEFPKVPENRLGGYIYAVPVPILKEYCIEDSNLALQIFLKQQDILEQLSLESIFKFECELIPILIKMRLRGVRVNLSKTAEVGEELGYAEQLLRKQLPEGLNVNSGPQLATLYDKQGIKYPTTEKGNPSFKGEWLKEQDDPISKLVLEIKKLIKMRSSFIQKAILDKAIDDKIYASFHPLRSDEGGTITGRFSCRNPNLQQIPARDEEYAPLIRGVFIPEKNYTSWIKFDYSQIEYRMLAHYAADFKLRGYGQVIKAYQEQDADYHEIVRQMLGGGDIKRKPVKNLNFMLIYGGGKKKLINMLKASGIDTDPAKFLDLYHQRFPIAKGLMQYCSTKAESEGSIKTLLGRRILFNKYIPKGERGVVPLPYNVAFAKWGSSVELADSYKAINYLLQGSAADIMKLALIECERRGLFKTVGYPHVTVHDELDFSYHPDLHKEFIEVKNVMENLIELNVPIKVDTEVGPDWGHVEDFSLE